MLRLLLVFLLQLLRLLRVPLLYLLLPSFIGVLFRQLLVLLLLLLLEFVSFLILLRHHFFLLLLVLLVEFRFACIGSAAPFYRRKIVRMGDRASSGVIFRTPLIPATRGRSVGTPCLFGRHGAAATEFSGLRSRCNRWLAHVRRRAHLRIASRRLHMLS